MTTGLSYDGSVAGTMSYIQQVAELAVVSPTDTNYTTILPAMITYAENRIYRDLDLLSTQQSITGYTLTAGNRTISIPQGTLVTTQQINIITPVGTVNPNLGTRNPCLPVTKEFLDIVYGSQSNQAIPAYYAPFNDNVFYFGPYPDQSYGVEIVGTYRPASLSATNLTTFVSLYLPDLMLMASMIYISAYQRNFGRQSDDPAMAQSYEGQYTTLLKSASVEEARKKYESVGWTSESPSVAATPTRG
jgi:hypothetical protein